MNLFENPIFRTQKRLVHRAGFWPVVLIALVIGLCFLMSLDFKNKDSGWFAYGWLLVIQAAILFLGVFSKISRTLVEERKNGLLDSNRLTPLSPTQLFMGYWLGAPLREIYAAASLMPVGLVLFFLIKLPLAIWLETQLLLITTTLFFGLFALLAGMVFKRDQGGGIMISFLALGMSCCYVAREFSLTNFLLPYHSISQIFAMGMSQKDNMWLQSPFFFKLKIPSLFYTLGSQFLFGFVLWHAAIRKFANPQQAALSRTQVLGVFACMLILQHGLIWHIGDNPLAGPSLLKKMDEGYLTMVHTGILFIGLVLVCTQCLEPERVRLLALKTKNLEWKWLFLNSGPAMGGALAIIASLCLLTHFVHLEGVGSKHVWRVYFFAATNIWVVFLSTALFLEICRLQFNSRANGIFVLGFFLLFFLPWLPSAIFFVGLSQYSPLSTGFAIFNHQEDPKLICLAVEIPTICHILLLLGLGIIWKIRWGKSFRRFCSDQREPLAVPAFLPGEPTLAPDGRTDLNSIDLTRGGKNY